MKEFFAAFTETHEKICAQCAELGIEAPEANVFARFSHSYMKAGLPASEAMEQALDAFMVEARANASASKD